MGQISDSGFRPAWWLRNAHLQTLWPTFFRRRPMLELSPERVELADGDFIDLAWTRPNGGPVVIVIHGLEGSLDSHYARATLDALHRGGFHALFMHLRGCSHEPNRLDRSYHSGASEDLAAVLGHISITHATPVWGAVGFSLGGNLLLKYLGERGADARLQAAVAVSVPFRLSDCTQKLEHGLSRMYRDHLMKRLRRSYLRRFARRASPLDVDVGRLRGFFDFDDQVTAPLNGFAGAKDYYSRCSSRNYLHGIQVNTLILHALDDPFMYAHTLPDETELGPGIRMEVSPAGGHVGFIAGPLPGRVHYWLDQRIAEFMRSQTKHWIPVSRHYINSQ